MIYNKLNLMITEFCAKKDKSRQEITGVLFKKDRTVATDSISLIEVKTPEIKTDDFPLIPNTEFKEMKKDYIIPAQSVKKILANIPKKREGLQILNNAVFCNASGNEEDGYNVEFASTDLEKADKVSTRAIFGKYPDYKMIFPEEPPVDTIVVDARELKKICDFWIKNNKNVFEIRIYGNEKSLMIKDEFDGQEVKALLMPIKNNN